jgi:N-acetylglucosamine-6-sulfatase
LPINSRQTLRAASRLFVLIASCLAALCLMVGSGTVTQAQVPKDRPNIVFLLTDDMDEGLLNKMPIVQARLARHGVKFNNAFVTLPLCCPSRATTLTGQYAHNHDVLANIYPEGGAQKFRELGQDPSTVAGDESTVAVWLRSSGYKTGLIGKYLNQYDEQYVPPGWTEWYGTMGSGGGRDGNTLYEDTTPDVVGDGTIRTYDQYPTDLYRDKALNFISNADEPFFLWVGFQAPHSPAPPAPRHADMFNDLRLPRPPSFNEADVSDKPLWVRSLPRLTREDIRRLTRFQRNRVRSLQAVDEAVGAIMDLLKQQGELSNTYIVFTSDNGLNMGEHRWTKKAAPYEESVGVPLLVRGPRVEKGAVRDHIVTNNDLAPTFATWGQTAVPGFVDGKSFDSLLGTTPPTTADWRSAVLLERLYQPLWTPGSPSRPDKDMPPYAAIRTANQLYVKYSSGEGELYDLPADPYQLTSQYATASPEDIARFDGWLDALRDCTAAYCQAAESGPDTRAPDTEITQKPTDPSSSGEASFSFTGTDDATLPSDLVFQCRLDSQDEAAFAACTNPRTYSGLATGSHTFEVRAVDEAGNVDATPASYSWRIQPPDPPSP